MADNWDRLRTVVLGRLESLERAGVQQLPKSRPQPVAEVPVATAVPAPPATKAAETTALVAIEATAGAADSAKQMEEDRMPKSSAWQLSGTESLFDVADEQANVVSKATTLEVLREDVASCTRCTELAEKRTQTVFGVGNPRARLCFMGEAPGADEDRLGEPFVGRAGQLLTKIIEACQLKREDVYILNMIKCRPPGNRNPLLHELANCRGYLDRQLELIEPEFICCLGAVAAQNLLNTTTSIGRLRGKWHTYRGAKVVCTFHPAYLLRNPAAKKDAWDDMKFLMREMGVEL